MVSWAVGVGGRAGRVPPLGGGRQVPGADGAAGISVRRAGPERRAAERLRRVAPEDAGAAGEAA